MSLPIHPVLLSSLLLIGCAGKSAPPVDLIGTWEGQARVIVDYCNKDHLPIQLTILRDGSVSGKIGDSTLVEGRFDRNRGTAGRLFKIKTDYIIAGRLDGPLVAEEQITRESVQLPFNLKYGQLDGGLHTSGSKLGSGDQRILSATFALARTPTPSREDGSGRSEGG